MDGADAVHKALVSVGRRRRELMFYTVCEGTGGGGGRGEQAAVDFIVVVCNKITLIKAATVRRPIPHEKCIAHQNTIRLRVKKFL